MNETFVPDRFVNQILSDFVDSKIANKEFNGEDDWFSFNPNIDINIWTGEDNKIKATAYPVVNGRTDITVLKEIKLSRNQNE